MAKFLGLFFILFVAIASDMGIVPKVYGKLCIGEVGFNICTPTKNEICHKYCDAFLAGHKINTVTCMIRSDGSSYCECVYVC
ncbi:hypothetical protein P3L10_027236 [Capsicum annuum]